MSTPVSAVLLYVTAANPAEAQSIGRTVVEEGLAACANILDGMRSIYRWTGRVEEASETVLILKTAADRTAVLVSRVKALHSYETPCVVTLPIADGNPEYLAWIQAETR